MSLYVCATFCLYIHPSIDTWVISTFWLLCKTAMNIGIQIFTQVLTFISFGYTPLKWFLNVLYFTEVEFNTVMQRI